MTQALGQLVSRFGRLDVVIANAGINGVWAPIDGLKLAEGNSTISVNPTGTFMTMRASVPELKQARAGSIIVVSSINGTRTFTNPCVTANTATKAGQVAMVQKLALELARIRTNAVFPGKTETNIDADTRQRKKDDTAIPVMWPEGQIPITGGRPGRSEDVGEVIAFLASNKSRQITGAPIWIDVGEDLLR